VRGMVVRSVNDLDLWAKPGSRSLGRRISGRNRLDTRRDTVIAGRQISWGHKGVWDGLISFEETLS
jgi:hypothetical protein